MIRKLLLPALLVGLLGGCVSAGYSYRDGYYYGQPSVEYRYYDYGYGYGYPYSYGYYPYAGRYGYYNYYGYPYRYGYYGYPYYPHYRHRHPKPPTNDPPGSRPPHTDGGDDNPPPWRDLNRRRRDDVAGRELRNQDTLQPRPPREAPRREVRGDDSRMGQAMKRTQETRRRQSGDVQEP